MKKEDNWVDKIRKTITKFGFTGIIPYFKREKIIISIHGKDMCPLENLNSLKNQNDIDEMLKLIEKKTDSYYPYKEIGKLLLELNELDLAKKCFQKAIKLKNKA